MTEELFKNMHLQLSSEDIRRIDEWKISHGMKSRTEAIRAMIRMATENPAPQNFAGARFAENEKNSFIKPGNSLPSEKNNNESVEELVRKLVKDELSKILKEGN